MIATRPYHTHCVRCSMPRAEWTWKHDLIGERTAAYCSKVCKDSSERLRNRCYRLVSAVIELGLLPLATSSKCADCGAPATCYDHRDYSKPLSVDAVCHGCNIRRGPALHPHGVLPAAIGRQVVPARHGNAAEVMP